MAKINLNGNVVCIDSEIQFEDLALVLKNDPKAASLKDENGKEYFAVGIGDGQGALGKYGATLAKGVNGTGVVSYLMKAENAEAAKAEIAESFTQPISMLEKVRASVVNAAEAIKADRDALISSIQVG